MRKGPPPPSHLPLDRPACPKCGARTMLARVEPAAKPDQDLYSFECPACRHAETVSRTRYAAVSARWPNGIRGWPISIGLPVCGWPRTIRPPPSSNGHERPTDVHDDRHRSAFRGHRSHGCAAADLAVRIGRRAEGVIAANARSDTLGSVLPPGPECPQTPGGSPARKPGLFFCRAPDLKRPAGFGAVH